MKKGFTLIELLVAIILLAIVALIATPIILGIIKDTKENAFKESITGIVDDAILESTLKKMKKNYCINMKIIIGENLN